MAWQITADKAGKFTAQTSGKYVDRDIDFIVPAGSASVTGKTANPSITWDATTQKIKANYSTTVNGSATAGWVTSVSGATVSGTTSVTAASLDEDLVASNIKKDVEILGVTGTLTGADFGTTSATRNGNTVSWGTGWIEEGSSTGATTSRTAGAGTGTATATSGISIGAKTTTKPSSGQYITVTAKGNVSTGTGWITSGNTDSNTETSYYTVATTSRTAGAGSVSASANGIELGTAVTSQPASGKYITVQGSGSVSTGTGWVTNGSTSSNTATKYYPIDGATLKNSATSGKTYTDVSSSAPVLISGDYLYIDKGYFDTDSKISLAQLVPNGSNVTGKNSLIYKTVSAYDNDGVLVSGTMEDATLSASATGSATISSVSVAYDNTSKFNVTGSASISGTASAATATTGYAIKGTTTGTGSTTGTANLSAKLDKIAGSATATATAAIKAGSTSGGELSLGSKGSGTWTDAADTTGTLKTDKDTVTSGVYVKVDRAAYSSTVTATATPAISVTTAGYGTASQHGITTGSATTKDQTVSLAAGSLYVPIKGGSVTVSNGSVTTAPKVTLGNSATGVTTSTTDKGYKVTFTATPTNGTVGKATSSVTAGWVSSATNPSSNITVTPTVDGSGTTTSGVRTVDVYLDTTSVTKTLSTGAVQNAGSTTYTTTGVLETAPSSVPYFSLTAGASGTTGKVYTGASNSTTAGSKPVKYIEIYSGSYTYSAS